MKRYSLGIDFGTLSARAVIVDLESGREMGGGTSEYAHAVMDTVFLDGSRLPSDFALQHPRDYLDSLCAAVRGAMEASGVDASDIVGIGVDFTACTVLPVTEDGTPLCFLSEFHDRPHAYAKLWKHHAAQAEAEQIAAVLSKRKALLSRYGGTVSSEFLFPKILETLHRDEEVYARAHRFMEAGDYIVRVLTGVESRSLCCAGFKAFYDEDAGYPDEEIFAEIDPRMRHVVDEKLGRAVTKMSACVGCLTEEMAEQLGLRAGIPVAPAFIDAHAALPALGVTEAGSLLMIIGTSSCHILLGERDAFVPGISGSVKGGIVDGLYAFEAGQACVGDGFDWLVKNCVPPSYYAEAETRGIGIHTLLTEKASALPVGSGGLLAIDFFNGNRTPYVNGTLRGAILGLGIDTRPEQIYRAMIEATAYGTRRIVELYEQSGVKIERICAAGGIAEKNPLLMQIYADVLGREIFLSGTTQACAYGSALLGAVAGGAFATLPEASRKLKKLKDTPFRPSKQAHDAYLPLYEEYKTLSDYLAKGESLLMKRLKAYR